jgi:8-hydroxy-5-deazaflavin:NADPH oxidoreductase
MRIGIVGTGNIGGALAAHFARAGHEVAVSNSRGPESLAELVAALGPAARALAVEEAMRFGDAIAVAIPLGRVAELPADAAAGKVVIDANNYYASRDGQIAELDDDRTTSSELLQRHLRGARVVKAFNTMRAQHLRDLGRPAGDPQRLALPISGDDDEAKRLVAGLIDEIGFDAVDAGSLAEGGRKHQPGSAAYGVDLTADELRAALRR